MKRVGADVREKAKKDARSFGMGLLDRIFAS
jgi:hypothetical protein